MLCKPSSSGRLRDKVFSCIGVIWCIWLTWLCFVFLLFLYAVELKGMSQNFSKLAPSAQINNEELGAFKIFSFDLEKKHISILEVFLLLCDGGEQRKFGNLLQWLKYIFYQASSLQKWKPVLLQMPARINVLLCLPLPQGCFLILICFFYFFSQTGAQWFHCPIYFKSDANQSDPTNIQQN